MLSTDLSIYYVIGKPPNEYFDSSRIGSYFPISNSLLLSSISRLFFDLPDQNFQIFGIGQEKDYMPLQHTNNIAYCQLGNNTDEFFKISADRKIQFNLFSKLDDLFDNLSSRIINDSSENILIILQDHGSLYNFSYYPHAKLLFILSKAGKKNFLIYDDSCQSGSLIDMFKKNNLLFTYFQKDQRYINNKNKRKNRKIISILYYFARFRYFMFEDFKDCLPTFFPEFITFLSNVPEDTTLFELPFYNIIRSILDSYQNQDQELMNYFLTPINKDFFDKLQKDSNFNISGYNEILKEYEDLDSFLSFLQKNNINNLANLMMIKLYYEFTCKNTSLQDFDIFSEENYSFFLEIEKVAFKLPKTDENRKIQRQGEFYLQVKNFFLQYYKKKLFFFHFISSLEIITSTSLKKTSLSYSSISVNSITNTPAFAYFIRNAFFNYGNHSFSFIDFRKHIYKDKTKKKKISTLFPSYNYKNCTKPDREIHFFLIPPKHFTYPNEKKSDFEFRPSLSLTKKIAAVRFLTHFVKEYLSPIQNPKYFTELNFSSGFSRIPSKLLINFISLSILPSSDAFPSELKLNNESFLNVLKFSNLIFQTNLMVTSIDKRPMQFSINKDRFEFITFFSVILSSKIRCTLAKNLLLNLSNKSDFHKSIYLFSIIELEYAKKFLQSNHLNECTDGSTESTKQFLDQLFKENFIKKYYGFTPTDKQDEKSKEFKKLRELKKSPELNLQKMFLDLESAILNILPNDVFVFSIIYSYLFLKYHNKYDKNPPIQEDIQKIYQNLSRIFDVTKIEKIIERINVFNCLKDILQFCNNYIIKSLQKTFDFLQYFYQTYYYVNFCKVFNQYNGECVSTLFDKFLNIIPSNFDQKIFDLLTEKLKPFPLFCLPFIFFDPFSYKKYKTNFTAFISTPLNHLNENDYNSFPDSIYLLESNYFYSEQFRIHLSNLSLYRELKKSIIENINILNKFLNDDNNEEFSHLMSHHFFKNPFSDSPERKNNKNAIDCLANTRFEAYMKQSISSFIKNFISTMKQFLQFDLEELIKLDCTTDIDDLQLFFCPDKKSNVYIDYILNNITDLMNTLSISKSTPTVQNFINEDIINLAYSVFAARFNNKVEIEPIDELIPKYEKKSFEKSDWEFPSNGEFMALCSAIPFTLSPTDKFRKRFFSKSSSSMLNKKEEEEEEEVGVEEDIDEYYSSSNSSSTSSIKTIGNYRNEFGDDDDDDNDFNEQPSNRVPTYEKIVYEALNISEIEIYDIQEKHDVRFKKWTEIIWNIFFDIFNKKLKEINLNFDTNNKYSQGFYGIDCLNTENIVIRYYFPQLDILKDLQEKEIWIGRFIDLHQKYEFEIKSAYIYAIISAFVFLRNYYTFDTS